MNFLAFTRPHDLAKLGDVLWTAFPEWFYTDPQQPQFKRTDVTLSGDGQNGWIMFPESTDPARVMSVINAYQLAPDPTPPTPTVTTDSAQIPNVPLWQHLVGKGWIWDNAPA